MPLQFTQEEVEAGLADKMPHGMRVKIARRSGLKESYLKRQFNPDDEKASCAFRILQVACAYDDEDADAGEEFWQTLTSFRELSKKRQPNQKSTLEEETAALNSETAEFIAAKLTGKPYNEQLSELLDIEAQLLRVKQTLINEFNALKEKSPEISSVKFANFGNK